MTNARAIVLLLCGIALALLAMFLHGRHVGAAANFALDPSMLSLDVDAVDFAEVDFGGKRPLVLRRSGTKWRIESPFKSDADGMAVKAMVDAFALSTPIDSLGASELVRLGRTVGDYGLGEGSRRRVTLGVGDRRETAYVGGATPSGREVYAMVEGGGAVFTVPASVAAALPKDESSFRGKSLFARAGDRKVVGLELRPADSTGLKLSCNDGTWSITAPTTSSAKSADVSALVDELIAAKLFGFEPSEELVANRLAAHGLAAGAGFVVTLRFGADESEQVVFGGASSNGVFVLVRDGTVVAHAASSLAERCREGMNALKDTRVFMAAASEISGVSFAGSPYVYTLDRGTNGAWKLSSPVSAAADPATVAAFVARALEIDHRDSSSDGVKVSLSTPGTNFASVTVPVKFFADKGLSFADLRDKTVLSVDPASVERISVTTRSGESREGAASAAADVVKAISTLVALRVETPSAMPKDFARCGLSKPAYRVVLDFGQEGGSLRKNLLVGDPTPDGKLYVSAGGVDAAIFVVAPEVAAPMESFVKASPANAK